MSGARHAGPRRHGGSSEGPAEAGAWLKGFAFHPTGMDGLAVERLSPNPGWHPGLDEGAWRPGSFVCSHTPVFTALTFLTCSWLMLTPLLCHSGPV